MCAMTSNLYDWDMRNLAKVSPKLTKTDTFGLFWFSSKLSIRFERIVYNLSTPCSGAMCAMTSQLYDWDMRNLAKVSSKLTKTDIFGLFWFSSKLSIRFERIVYKLFTPCSGFMCAMTSNLYDWDMRNLAIVSPKLTKTDIFGLFWFSFKLSIRFERIVYNLSTPCSGSMCAMTSNLYDWDMRNSAKVSPKLTKTDIFGLFWFSFKLSIRFERIVYNLSTPCSGSMCAMTSE